MMTEQLKNLVMRHRRALIILTNAVLVSVAYLLAFALRFDFDIPQKEWDLFCQTLAVVVIVKLVVLAFYRLHEGLWRYVSISDAVRLVKALTIASLIFVAAVSILTRLERFPRSVIFMDWVFTIGLLGAKRFSLRALREVRKAQAARRATDRRTLIVGAGDAGDMAVRELNKNESLRGHHIVGFLDDDPRKRGLTIHGYPVFGALEEAPRVVREEGITDLLVAMPTAPKRVVRELVERCSGLGIRFHILPAISDFITGHLQVQAIRTVHVEDLLGREPVKLDRSRVEAELKGARVMVTGAGGSIGSELVRQVAAFSPARLILVESGENALFEIDRELGERFRHVPRAAAICDIKHADTVERVFAAERPEYVFHAAAYKHVPLMEGHPDEAVLNNVKGTMIVAEAARRHGCRKMVLISSDKAVRPANVMGATKRVAELLLQAMEDRFSPPRHQGTKTHEENGTTARRMDSPPKTPKAPKQQEGMGAGEAQGDGSRKGAPTEGGTQITQITADFTDSTQRHQDTKTQRTDGGGAAGVGGHSVADVLKPGVADGLSRRSPEGAKAEVGSHTGEPGPSPSIPPSNQTHGPDPIQQPGPGTQPASRASTHDLSSGQDQAPASGPTARTRLRADEGDVRFGGASPLQGPSSVQPQPPATICKFAAVRFGNVLGSNGSVIPIFRRQIEAGGPVTVTHPEMTRFFMTIPEAVELVLQAGALAKGGEIFVLDMGEPVRIADLARNMIELSGLEVGKDIRIEYTGARPGEKIFEELVAHGEDVDETTVPKLMIHRRDGRLRLTPAEVGGRIDRLVETALTRDPEATRTRLWETVGAHDPDVKQPKA